MAPLARKSSISSSENPSSVRTSSLCSPISGARFAGTLATSCTCIGLLIVKFRFPPAPSIGTTISFAWSCGSLTTSLGALHDAECKVGLIEDFLPVRHRL